jgi:hypothetical protein
MQCVAGIIQIFLKVSYNYEKNMRGTDSRIFNA